MKKTVFLILAALMILLCAWAAADTWGDFTYRVQKDGSALLTGYTGPEGEVVIPNTLDGHPVTGVDGNPFWRYPDNMNCAVSVARDHPYLATIDGVLYGKADRKLIYCPPSREGEFTIPQGIAAIEAYAFVGCTGLTAVSIPDSVTSIGHSSFRNCTGLTAVSIPDSVTSIERGAFGLCTGLTTISIPNSVTSIEPETFYFCTGLTTVSIPNSVTNIEMLAFYGCTGLTVVSIPDSVTSIGSKAFFGCTGLTSVSIPDSVTSIGSSAFFGCTGLTAVSIPDSVTSIGDAAFASCTSLTQFEISAVHPVYEQIDGVLFHRESHTLVCYPAGRKATKYVIPDSVTSIENYAFYGCTGLTAVSIPDSVTGIGWYAFDGCTGLTAVSIPDSVTRIENSTFHGCTGLTAVSIPDSVTRIGRNAFSGCTGLTAVSIPDSVTSIGEGAFHIWNEETQTYDPMTSIVFTVPRDSYAERYCRENVFTFVYPDFTWRTLTDGTVGITRYDGADAHVVIPAEIDGHPVTGLADGAFAEAAHVTSIEIPDSVVVIGELSFAEDAAATVVSNAAEAVQNAAEGAAAAVENAVDAAAEAVQNAAEGEAVAAEAAAEGTVWDAVETFWDADWDTAAAAEGAEDAPAAAEDAAPATYTATAFRGCSIDLTVTCGLGSFASGYCERNNIPYTIRQEDYSDDSSWLE